MPYHWLPPSDPEQRQLHLAPWVPLGPRGFVWFMALTAGLIALPLVAMLATPVFWGLLPFLGAAIAGIWWALRRSQADRRVTEDLTITPDNARLLRLGPRGRRQEWQANPYWVQVRLYPVGGPVPDYLTLKGNGREVEIGAFLAPEERRSLYAELREAFAEATAPARPG